MNRTPLSLLAGTLLLSCATSIDPAPRVSVAPPPEPPPPVVPAPDDGVSVSGDLLAPMPVAVTSFGAARSGAHVYVLGGYHGEPHVYNRAGQSKTLWRLALTHGARWERVGAIHDGLQGLALVAHGDEVCRVGGTRIDNAAGEPANMRSVRDVACFHTSKRTWRDLPPLPAGRSSHEATMIGNTLWVAGGWELDGGPTDAVWRDDVLSLDLADTSATWKSTRAPFQRRALDVSAQDGRLVVIGGLGPDRAISPAVDIFDPATGQWSRGPDYPGSSFGVAATTFDGAIHASARDGVVYRLDAGSWTRVTSLAFPRFFHQLLASDAGLIAVGGITGMQAIGRTRHTERLSLSDSPKIEQWVMPFPGTSKNRQGVFLANDALYLFGGNNSLGQHDFAPHHFVDEGWRLHLPSLQFAPVAAYPEKRQTMQTVSTPSHGISIGGFGHPRDAGESSEAISHADGFTFDFATETWSPRQGLPRGRTQFGLVAHDGQLWAFGGLNYDPSRKGPAAFDHVTSILTAPDAGAFDVSTVKLTGPRRAFAGAALGEHYYLVGGMKEGFALVDDCERFDFHETKFESFPCPTNNRLSAELVTLGGKLYIVGGSVRVDGKMTPDRSIEVFDPQTNRWSVFVDDVGFDTKHMRALAYRDRLLLVSTHMPEPRIRAMLIAP